MKDLVVMSKKLEALEQIEVSHKMAHIDSGNYGDFEVWFEDYYKIIKKALTPPTEQEVCKALNEWLPRNWRYDREMNEFYYEVQAEDKTVLSIFLGVHATNLLEERPKALLMLGRFYEEENE